MAVPKIRFPGFTEDWEQRKLSGMATFSKGSGYSKADLKTSGKPIILYGRMYTKYETIIRNVDTFAEEKAGSVYSESGDVIVPASGETAQDISRASVVANSGILLGGDINIIHPNNELNPGFLALTISNGNQQKKLSMKAQGATIVHLHNEDLKGVDILCPSIDEQTLISEFFERIDNTITLHQRKLESMKLLKKSLLQKMLPKSGETVPEVRFPGFTDAWEQRKLGDVIEIESGMDYKSLNPGDIPVYGTGGYMLSVDKALSYERDAIGIGRKGTIDKPYILKAPFWTVDTLFYCIPKENYSLNFVHCIFQKINWKKKDESTGVPSLSKTIIKNIPEYFPSLSEQKKLGKFFSSLDDTITLHQRKVEILHKLKKSLLQQMFV